MRDVMCTCAPRQGAGAELGRKGTLSDSKLPSAGEIAAARAELGAAPRPRPPAAPRSRPARPKPLYPQLRARKNASPKAVAAHQRARLHAATIEAVTRNGYAATTVEDVVWLAGVSKKTLYRHFESKEDCFFSTYDLVVRQAVDRISAAYRRGGEGESDWTAGLCLAFSAFVAELVQHPKPSRLALVEVLAAGPAAQPRIERGEAVFARMISQSLAQASDGVALPPLLVRSLVGGIWFVSRARLLEDRPEEIAGCGLRLLDWILAHRSPAAASIPRAAPPRPASEPPDPASYIQGDDRTRMLLAAAQIAAEGGYLGLSGGEIAERAGVGPDDFADAFDDPTECFLSSLELLNARALARALREAEGAPTWPAWLCRAIRTLLCEVAADRVYARASFVEVFAAGPAGVERRAALIRSFAGVLARRAPRELRPDPLVAEATVGSVWSLVHRHVARDRARALPSLAGHAAYLALAPIVGAEAAAEAIHAELGGGGAGAAPDAPAAAGDAALAGAAGA